MDNNETPDLIFLLLGRSSTCKTTLCSALSGNKNLKIGLYGTGKSCTDIVNCITFTNSKFFNGKKVMLIDTIGLEDSRLKFLDDNIIELISAAILKIPGRNHIDGIIMFEDSNADASSIGANLVAAKKICQTDLSKSTFVLVTKTNLIQDSNDIPQILSNTEQEVKNVGISAGIMEFMTPYNDVTIDQISGWNNQLSTLTQKLSTLKPISLQGMQEKREKLLAEAHRIQAAKTTYVTVSKDVPEDIYEARTGQKMISVPVEKRRPGIEGIFGGTKTVMVDVPTSYTYYEKVTKIKTVTEEVRKEVHIDLCMQEAIKNNEEKIIAEINEKLVSI